MAEKKQTTNIDQEVTNNIHSIFEMFTNIAQYVGKEDYISTYNKLSTEEKELLNLNNLYFQGFDEHYHKKYCFWAERIIKGYPLMKDYPTDSHDRFILAKYLKMVAIYQENEKVVDFNLLNKLMQIN